VMLVVWYLQNFSLSKGMCVCEWVRDGVMFACARVCMMRLFAVTQTRNVALGVRLVGHTCFHVWRKQCKLRCPCFLRRSSRFDRVRWWRLSASSTAVPVKNASGSTLWWTPWPRRSVKSWTDEKVGVLFLRDEALYTGSPHGSPSRRPWHN